MVRYLRGFSKAGITLDAKLPRLQWASNLAMHDATFSVPKRFSSMDPNGGYAMGNMLKFGRTIQFQ